MTEYAMDLNALTNPSVETNGQSDNPIAPEPEALTGKCYVDPVRGVFVTSRGDEITLSDKPVSALVVERIQAEGKPKIPMIEVSILGRKQSEPHVGHEGYQARLKEWESESQIALMRYLFIIGTKGQPPQDFVDEQRPFFPNATDGEMKYLWVASRLPDEDMAEFTEAVMGRTLPTTKAVEQVSNFTGSK